MTLSAETFLKKGYTPIACNRYAGIALQGEYLRDFWMWNRQYIERSDKSMTIQTVQVTDLKEAALRYWRDGWVPLAGADEDILGRMEDALRRHRGLKWEGVKFPDGRFLKKPEDLSEDFLSVQKSLRKKISRERQ